MNQNNYGWGNAVSDILGAVMQRNAERGEQKKQANMYLDAANFGEELKNLDYGGQTSIQDLASRANPNSNYTNKTASLKAQQGLFPTSFNQSVPTSDTLGQGLLGQPLNSQPAQANNFEFTNPLDKYSKENNPVSITTSAPKTLQEQTRMINAQIPKKMQEMMKAGYKPKEALALLKESANQAIADRTETYKQSQIDSFETEQDPRKKIMIGMKAGLIGKEGAMMLVQPDIETKVINTGGENVVVGFSKMTGKYVNLKDGTEIAPNDLQEMLKPTLTPAQVQSAELQREQIRRQGQRYSGGPSGNYSNTTSRPSTDESWASTYESGSGLTNDQSIIDTLYELGYRTPAQDIQLQQAISRRERYWKVSSGGQYGARTSNTGDSRIDGMIANMRSNGAPEQVISAMVAEEKGKVANIQTQNQPPPPPPPQNSPYVSVNNEGVKTIDIGSMIGDWWAGVNDRATKPNVIHDPYYNR